MYVKHLSPGTFWALEFRPWGSYIIGLGSSGRLWYSYIMIGMEMPQMCVNP